MNHHQSAAVHTSVRIMQTVQQRSAERAALANNPWIPPANLRAVLGQFDQETATRLAPDFNAVAGHLDELRAKHVVQRFDYRPTDPGRASLLGAVVHAAAGYSDRVLTQRLNDAIRDNDLGLVQELSMLVESRVEKATGDALTGLNHALVDATATLNNTPQMLESRAWGQWIEDAAKDLSDLRTIAALPDAAARLDVYTTPEVNALPTLIPSRRMAGTGSTVAIGFTEPAGV